MAAFRLLQSLVVVFHSNNCSMMTSFSKDILVEIMIDGNCVMVILHYSNHNGFMKPDISINGFFKNLESVRRKNKELKTEYYF